MALDKVGHFVLGVIVKARMDRDGYLACIGGTDKLAVLPIACADGPYRVHDRFYAAIKEPDATTATEQNPNPLPILSQRSGFFLRHVCHAVFGQLIAEGRIVVDAVATVRHAGFVKIAVSSPTGEDAVKLCVPALKDFRLYSRLQPSLIQYSHMIEQFIRESLKPAPVHAIERLALTRAVKQVEVCVPSSVVGRFVGVHGMNVAVASRLTGHSIRVIGTS